MIKIAVCVKAVSAGIVSLDGTDPVINPYDLKMLNRVIPAAKKSQCHISYFTMGSGKAEQVLRRCLAMGGDEAYLVSDPAYAGSDTVATVHILAEAIKRTGDYDLIICGQKAVDGETGQVAYGLSEKLKYRVLDKVEDIILFCEEKTVLIAEEEAYAREISAYGRFLLIFEGYSMKEEMISLISLKKAKKKQIILLTNHELKLDRDVYGADGSKTKVIHTLNSIEKKEKQMIEGDCKSQTAFLCNYLTSKGMGL